MLEAIDAATSDQQRWTRDDLRRRMEFSLRSAYAYGTRALRTHILGLLDTARPGRSDLADQLLLLLDGAVTEAYLEGVAAPAKAAQRAAVTLLHSAR